MRNADRGVSDIVGFVLIFGLILTSVTVVYVTGFDSLTDTREQEELRNVERAYDILADNLREVSRGDAPSRDTEFKLGQSELYSGEPITITVGVGSETAEVDVYPIVYETSGGDRLLYVNGAVIRETEGGATMVSEPPIMVRDGRVLFPIIETRPTDVVGVSGGNVLVNAESTGATTLSYHDPGETYQTDFTIETPRTDMWERYCERNPDYHVYGSGTNDTQVTCAYGDTDPYDTGADSVYVQFRRLDISFST